MRRRLPPDRAAAALLFLLPLLPFLGIPTPSPSQFGVALGVRAVALLLVPLALLGGGAGAALRHPVFRWLGAWLGIALLASVLSPDPLRALLGEPLRAEGWIQYLAWACLALAAAVAFSATEQWRRFASWSVAVTLLAGTVAVVTELLAWLLSPDGSFNYRPYGWYMNPLFFGNALALQAGLAFSLAPAAGRRRWMYLLSGAGLLILALASGSRSVVLGVGFALLLGAAAMRAARGRISARTLGLAGGLAAALLALVLLAPASFSRLGQVIGDSSLAGRFVVWGKDLPFILERPLLGWGLEHQLPLFLRSFSADFLVISRDVFDRAHNALVESLVTTGVFGLAAAVGLLIAAAQSIIRQMRREPAFRSEGAVLLGMLAYAAAADQFGFLTPFTLVALVPVLGRIVARDTAAPQAAPTLRPALAAALVGLALFLPTTAVPAWAAVTAARGVTRYAEDLPGATEDFLAATRLPTFFDGAVAKRYGDLIRSEILTLQVRDAEALLALGAEVRAVLLRAEAAHSWDFTLPMARAALLEQLGKLDPALLEEAIPTFEAVVAAHPERYEPRQLLAVSYLRAGRDADALRQYQEMLRRTPDDGRLHMMHAIILYRVGEIPEAFAALNRAEALLPHELKLQVADIRARMEAGEAFDPSADAAGVATAPLDMDRQGVVEP